MMRIGIDMEMPDTQAPGEAVMAMGIRGSVRLFQGAARSVQGIESLVAGDLDGRASMRGTGDVCGDLDEIPPDLD